jgi:enoyl-CoA hydratase/carnithine racemase
VRFVSLDLRDSVATVRLERPDKRNAVNLEMFGELATCGQELSADHAVRAVVLAGAGDVFCAGLDLGLFESAGPAALHDLLSPQDGSPANYFQRAALVWRELPVPVICAVHGVAYGAGLQIALGADIRIAAPDTRVSIMEVRWGLVPDMGLSVTARGLVRLDLVRELAWTGRVVGAQEARDAGLLTALADDPQAAALRLAGIIASHSPDAVRGIKALLREGWEQAPATSLALEAAVQSRLVGTANQLEATRANLEGRTPRFEP